MLQDKLIDGLKTELGTNKDIEDIVIFGSAARTKFQNYNDIDVLVVFRNDLNEGKVNSYVNELKIKYGIAARELFNYIENKNPVRVFNYIENRFLPYHVFYCKEKEMKLRDSSGKEFIREAISIKELTGELVTA